MFGKPHFVMSAKIENRGDLGGYLFRLRKNSIPVKTLKSSIFFETLKLLMGIRVLPVNLQLIDNQIF